LAQSLARLQRWFRDTSGRLPSPVEIVPDYDVVFGQRYRDGAVIGEDGKGTADFADHATLSGEPGTRAPHVPIIQAGKEGSTLDLFGRDFVLLSASEDWDTATSKLSNDALGLRFRQFSAGMLARGKENLTGAFGVGAGGAVLVRPDGFVAWRTNELPRDPAGSLVAVLRQLGCSGHPPLR